MKITGGTSPFERIKGSNDANNEYWESRERSLPSVEMTKKRLS